MKPYIYVILGGLCALIGVAVRMSQHPPTITHHIYATNATRTIAVNQVADGIIQVRTNREPARQITVADFAYPAFIEGAFWGLSFAGGFKGEGRSSQEIIANMNREMHSAYTNWITSKVWNLKP